jgi:hypothetical protein
MIGITRLIAESPEKDHTGMPARIKVLDLPPKVASEVLTRLVNEGWSVEETPL